VNYVSNSPHLNNFSPHQDTPTYTPLQDTCNSLLNHSLAFYLQKKIKILINFIYYMYNINIYINRLKFILIILVFFFHFIKILFDNKKLI
jgi:hypothetical protein